MRDANSLFLGIKHATPVMRRQGDGGSIISTASVAGLGGGGGPQAYSAAKAAVINLTKNAALELAPDRIRVNAIAPGVIRTPLAALDTDVDQTSTSFQPWPDPGASEDIAGLALFLASDDAGFITGETIACDGGILAQGPRLFRHDKVYSQEDRKPWIGMTYGTTGEKPRGKR